MYLKSIKAYGFKSFADKTEINFNEWENVNICTTILKQRNPITIKISKWNDKIKDILSQYYFGSSITLDVSEMDISKNETSMKDMFYGYRALTKIVVGKKWDTSGVEDMSNMFNKCENLTEIVGIENWDTSNVKNMSYMFCGCSSLKSLPANIANWDTKNVTDMRCMFYRCYKLESLPDISKWNISKVTNMSFMFERCNITNIPNKFL